MEATATLDRPRTAEELSDALLVSQLTKDMREAAKRLTVEQARYLVDAYYSTQKIRIETSNRAFASSQDGEPAAFIDYVKQQMQMVERQIQYALAKYVHTHEVGKYAIDVFGMGPILTAGLVAHIDITKAPYLGHIIRFAGLDPGMIWEKGQKRPYNARLKTLCWKIGDSFVKQSGRDKCKYGHFYRKCKQKIVEKDARGGYEYLAKETLEKRNIRDKSTRERYESGRLPDGRIDAMARRKAVVMFLSHFHHAWTFVHYGEPPKKPWVFVHEEDKHDAREFIHPYEMGWPNFGENWSRT